VENELTNQELDVFLINSIKEYAKYLETEEHEKEEGYKRIFLKEHQGLFENTDDLVNKIKLLGSQNFFPFVWKKSGILRHIYLNHEEKLRESLKELFDESKPLKERIISFIDILNKELEKDNVWEHKDFKVDLDSASFFLFMKEPKKYLLFTKKSEFSDFAKKFCIYENYPNILDSSREIERYLDWIKYCQNELIPNLSTELGRDADMLDAQDLVYCAVRYFSDDLPLSNPKERKLRMQQKEEHERKIKYLREQGIKI
jgi:hypothetical protein